MCCQYLDKFIDEYNKHDWSYAAALDDSADQVNLVLYFISVSVKHSKYRPT